ncbi:MAG TPA: hypothetical protein VFC07_08910 [Verrucomicrobiae bacterium]|nr:hypothetical protein [Verrucomicrobiae bacterium]
MQKTYAVLDVEELKSIIADAHHQIKPDGRNIGCAVLKFEVVPGRDDGQLRIKELPKEFNRERSMDDVYTVSRLKGWLGRK